MSQVDSQEETVEQPAEETKESVIMADMPIQLEIVRQQEGDDNADEILLECDTARNLILLGSVVHKWCEDNPDIADNTDICANAYMHTFSSKEEVQEGKEPTKRLWISENPKQLVALLAEDTFTYQGALMQLQLLINRLFDSSLLHGILVTAVFEDGGVGGFSALSTSIGTPVPESSILQLSAGSEAQSQEFRRKMTEAGVKFPDDGSLILPGQPGYVSSIPK